MLQYRDIVVMDNYKQLYKAFLLLKTSKDVENFLKDLCTPKEVKDFTDRLQIARLLDETDLSYRDIAEQTQASLTTVTRVARFLKDENNGGYKTVLKRMKK